MTFLVWSILRGIPNSDTSDIWVRIDMLTSSKYYALRIANLAKTFIKINIYLFY